jgi:CheY-like chemotaxis protein
MPAQRMREEAVFLLAEDNDSYAERTRACLQKAGVRNPLLRFHTGQEILNFLFDPVLDAPARARQSFVLLLDIQLPQVDGVQVWQRVKDTPEWQDLPVVMLTTADDPREIASGCRLGLQAL